VLRCGDRALTETPGTLQTLLDFDGKFVLRKLGILNQGNKMLKEFLRQAENNDMAPIKEGNRE
jgi:hypothetical protein